MGTLGGFPNPALWLRRAKLGYAYAVAKLGYANAIAVDVSNTL
jgi:hypothetical protein